MDGDDDAVGDEAVGLGRRGVENLGDGLDLEIVVAGAERAHLVALALLRPVGDEIGPGAVGCAAFLDAVEIACLAPAAPDRPAGAAGEHRLHLRVVEDDGALRADAGRDRPRQFVGQSLLSRQHVGDGEAGDESADAAGDVEADAAGGDDAALVRVEGGDAADREAVAPVGVGHGVGTPGRCRAAWRRCAPARRPCHPWR